MANTNATQRKHDTEATTELTGRRWCAACADMRPSAGGFYKLVRSAGNGMKQQWRCEGCRLRMEKRKAAQQSGSGR